MGDEKMNYWVFVLGGKDADKTFERLLEKQNWGFWLSNSRVRNKAETLKEGNTILFYIGGSHGRYIAGEAKLISSLCKPNRESLSKPERGSLDGMVYFNNIDLWDNKKLYLTESNRECLDFIKNKKNWGMTFGQSIVAITEKDYKDIKGLIKERRHR